MLAFTIALGCVIRIVSVPCPPHAPIGGWWDINKKIAPLGYVHSVNLKI